jgi:hypothetical protein
MDKHSFPFTDTAIIVFIPLFLGGIVSGLILEPGLAGRRWRFLWLAAGSPALPVWIIALWSLVSETEIHPRIVELVVIGCVGALAGSVAGAFARRGWKRWSVTPRGVFWTTISRAVSSGLVATILSLMVSYVLVIIPALFMELILKGLEVATLEDLPGVLLPLVFGGCLFIGGHVSGRVLVPVLPRDLSRFLFVALANPAIVLLVFLGIRSLRGAALPQGGRLFLYLACVITPLLGSFNGYRVGHRKYMERKEQARNRRRQNRVVKGPEPAGEVSHE